MLLKDDLDNLLIQLTELPSLIRSVIDGLSDQQLDTPYREGGWSIRQVVHHLADAHMNGVVRFKLIITEDNPTLKPYDQERWAELVDTMSLPPESSLQILEGLHVRWVALLRQLPEEAWTRSAHHPEIGTVTLADLLYNYVHHGRTHLRQIQKLRADHGW
jgi:hypothetical protein